MTTNMKKDIDKLSFLIKIFIVLFEIILGFITKTTKKKEY